MKRIKSLLLLNSCNICALGMIKVAGLAYLDTHFSKTAVKPEMGCKTFYSLAMFYISVMHLSFCSFSSRGTGSNVSSRES